MVVEGVAFVLKFEFCDASTSRFLQFLGLERSRFSLTVRSTVNCLLLSPKQIAGVLCT